jgi:hypothetical protein
MVQGTYWLALCVLAGDVLDPVRHQLQKIGSLSFVYEGEYERLDERGNEAFSKYPLSGAVEINFRDPFVKWTDRIPDRNGLNIVKTSVTRKQTRSVGEYQGIGQAIQKVGPGGMVGTRNYGREPIGSWFPMASFALATDQDAVKLQHLGEEKVDGRSLQVFLLTEKVDETRFWVDLERNAMASRVEFRRRGIRITKTVAVTYAEFIRPGGTKVWLPTTITHEMTAKSPPSKGWTETKEPWARWTYRLVLNSIKLDDEPVQATEVTFKRSFPVQDELNSPPTSTSTLAGAPPLPPAAAPISLEEASKAITEADVQKAQLQTTLRSPPVDWWSRLPWVLVAIGVVGLSSTLILQRRIRNS